jgi:hypothetical protein
MSGNCITHAADRLFNAQIYIDDTSSLSPDRAAREVPSTQSPNLRGANWD